MLRVSYNGNVGWASLGSMLEIRGLPTILEIRDLDGFTANNRGLQRQRGVSDASPSADCEYVDLVLQRQRGVCAWLLCVG